MTIYIPSKIKVGFQNRQGTYTGKLAYVIYFDNRNKLRKETSWQGWRDKNIEPQEFTNEPTVGFVLNKKVGGDSSGWNHRQTYARVFDPRGFEFEITVENLLYILQNADCSRGKGLEGEFVYAWDSGDLVLLPAEAPEFKEISKFTDIVNNNKFLKEKTLVIGAKYLTRDNHEVIYMGKMPFHDYKCDGKTKSVFIYNTSIIDRASANQYLIGAITTEAVDEYSDLYEKLQHSTSISPYERSEYIRWAKPIKDNTSFHLRYKGYIFSCYAGAWGYNVYTNHNEDYVSTSWGYAYYQGTLTERGKIRQELDTLLTRELTKEELLAKFEVLEEVRYLKNGREQRYTSYLTDK